MRENQTSHERKRSNRTRRETAATRFAKPGVISQEIDRGGTRGSVEIVEIPSQEKAVWIENDGVIDATDKELEGVSFLKAWMGERREKPKEEAAEVRFSGASQLSHHLVNNESGIL